jgi:hypothetical protein
MVVKTEEESEHDKDLADILGSVSKYNMRLNPTKVALECKMVSFWDSYSLIGE